MDWDLCIVAVYVVHVWLGLVRLCYGGFGMVLVWYCFV
jgi:hypothetical protein